MDDKARETAEKRKAQKVLDALLSDWFFCELDPMIWISQKLIENTNTTSERFADRIFLILAKYHRGKELHDLIKGHQWLANLAVLVKRHESVHIFHEDPAHNLTILNTFIKLQFCKTYRSMVMERPLSCIFYEAFIVISSQRTLRQIPNNPLFPIILDTDKELSTFLSEEGLKRKLDCIQQDFGD
ncbi:MAG: hypothetical protein LQ347_006076 [Umbilicaria vellea]|nr:MAG: hypothetical protein LQ347_006076 [Umbilicaria vellea]